MTPAWERRMYIEKANTEQIVRAISRLRIADDHAVLILIPEKEKSCVTEMISALNRKGIVFFGGIFPNIIYGDRKYDEGAIMEILPVLEKPFLIKGLDTEDIILPNFEKEITEGRDKDYAAIIILDGLTSNISLFLAKLFNRLGNLVHYFGGGAGSLTMKQDPCVFTAEGFVQDAAIVTFVKLRTILGVRHGWKQIMGPVVATKTRKNVIMELNWRNAFEVYREVVDADSGTRLTKKDFFNTAKAYPFGIYSEGGEDIVRESIAVNEKGELVCVGEVPENAMLSILKGTKSSLIQAAGQAIESCRHPDGRKIRCCLVIDCISRVLFLEDDFTEELATVQAGIGSISADIIPEGILTLGEISSYGAGIPEFLNKSIVVGAFYE